MKTPFHLSKSRYIELYPVAEELKHICLVLGSYHLPNWMLVPELHLQPLVGPGYWMDREWIRSYMTLIYRELNQLRKDGLIAIRGGRVYLTPACRNSAADWLDRREMADARATILQWEPHLPSVKVPWKQIEAYRAGQGPKPNLHRLFPIGRTLELWPELPPTPTVRPASVI
jgi:hypothetical protein